MRSNDEVSLDNLIRLAQKLPPSILCAMIPILNTPLNGGERTVVGDLLLPNRQDTSPSKTTVEALNDKISHVVLPQSLGHRRWMGHFLLYINLAKLGKR